MALVQSTFSLQKLGIGMDTLGMFVTTLAGIVVLWYGGHRVMDGALTIGQITPLVGLHAVAPMWGQGWGGGCPGRTLHAAVLLVADAPLRGRRGCAG